MAAEAPVTTPIVESPEAAKVSSLITRIASAAPASRQAGADEIAALVKSAGVAALADHELFQKVKASAVDAKSQDAREGALLVLIALCEKVGTIAEPYVVDALPVILGSFADKSPSVRKAAAAAGDALVAILCAHAIRVVLPVLFAGMEFKANWQTKLGALNILKVLAHKFPPQVAVCLPDIVPVVTECFSDAKPQVKQGAIAALTASCGAVGNRDIEPFVPTLVSCIANPPEVPDCVHKMSATVFVQSVEAPTLAIIVPLLVRGLRERQTAVKRKTCVIIDNMSKLVDNPADAAPFLPRLLPGLAKVADEVSDPECRKVAESAHKTLTWVGEEGKAVLDAIAAKPKADPKVVLATLKSAIKAEDASAVVDAVTLEYVVAMAGALIARKDFETESWEVAVVPYLTAALGDAKAQAVAKAFLAQCFEDTKDVKVVEDDEEGEDLCNCEFSLAYGGKILLNNATLWLKRGQRYGLCGPNGAGKSTLMRAIANGQLEGFPPPEELKTVYVEHDIQAEDADFAVLEFIKQSPLLKGTSHEEMIKVLGSVGFTAEMQAAPITSLSGGWKMKLALARAMLMHADILLLDEPTNHLDVTNVAWLENYLTNLPDVSSMVVSHDSGFLDHVCTHIIHYENRKLKKYKGNLSEFVKVKPEAKSYYDLAAATLKFKFPEPGFLEGIKSKDRAILKMMKCHFTYPNTTKKALQDITIQCSLNSRVAVVGPNGAGKSTMVKLLTGELEPQEGTVWKHPNLRVAYVAQHAFHHIEQHLEKTPNEYIRWRYEAGEDKEELSKVSRQVTKEEEEAMAAKVMHDGVKKVVECLLGRRKLKKSYEYEVQWVGLHSDNNSWLSRMQLEDMGFQKMVNEIDAKEAAAQGLYQRPLTVAVVQKHLEDIGLEAEFGTHSHMRGLSGGQKVKVVLAAAMWNNPHMLVLDEPTNYLDRDSLGALAEAIREYGGGVVMISHNSEFTTALCAETWRVDAGKLTAEGKPAWLAAAKLEWKRQEEMTDAFGNTVKVKQPERKLTRSEIKAKLKARKTKIALGQAVSDDEDY